MKQKLQHIKKTIPFLPLFLEEVEDKRIQQIAKRKKLNQKIQWLSLIFILLVVVTVSFVIIYKRSLGDLNILLIIVLGVLTQQIRYAYLDKQKLTSSLQETFIKEVHTYITKSIQSSWNYEMVADFNRNDLLEAEIFNENITLDEVNFSINGHYENIPLEIHKLSLEIRDESQTSANRSYYDGLLLVLSLSENEHNRTVVVPRITYQNFNTTSFHKLSLHQRGYQQSQKTDLAFNKYFKARSVF